MGFISAIKFLTAIPIFQKRKDSQEDWEHSVVYFPIVGLMIGLFLVGMNWVLGLLFPSAIVSILLIVFLVLITGALHLDGFIDTCDGIAGHKSVEDRWKVMKDSRVGAFGIIGVVLLLPVKYLSLISIPTELFITSLIIMPVISRWTIVFALFTFPYAKSEGLGKSISQSVNGLRFSISTITTLALVIVIGWMTNISYFYIIGPTIMLATWIIIVLFAGYLKRKFAGLTGDTYGAINEVSEVCVLIIFVLLSYNNWLV